VYHKEHVDKKVIMPYTIFVESTDFNTGVTELNLLAIGWLRWWVRGGTRFPSG